MRVLFIVAFEGFQDFEYSIPLNILKENGIKVDTVSNKKGVAIGGYTKSEIKIKKTITEINLDDYSAIIFIGGKGALDNLDNQESYKLIQSAYQKDKIIAAICIAPIILSNAGILEKKMATVWRGKFLNIEPSTGEYLKEKGAIYKDQSVVIDGNIITANGPKSAEEFGKAILHSLEYRIRTHTKLNS